MNDQDYEQGKRFVWMQLLGRCFRELGLVSPDGVDRMTLIKERESAISALRSLCERHGDNDWDEDLHLADIIGKHLGDYLDE